MRNKRLEKKCTTIKKSEWGGIQENEEGKEE